MTRIKKPRRQRSIGSYIVAAFMLLILLVTLGMMLVSISTSSRELQANAMDYTEQLVLRVNADIDLYVEYIKDISDFRRLCGLRLTGGAQRRTEQPR